MKNLVGLIQARMGSKRLPGKVMMPLADIPLVRHIHQRLVACPQIKTVVLATTQDPLNNNLVDYCVDLGMKVYRDPNEDDIASRLYNSAKFMKADAVLKVNADCPLIDPQILQQLILGYYSDDSLDYISNKIKWTLPEGYSAEIISYNALKWCAINLNNKVDRELVANWIKDNKERFKQLSIESEYEADAYFPSCCIDTFKDYELLSKMFGELYLKDELFGWPLVRTWLLNSKKLYSEMYHEHI